MSETISEPVEVGLSSSPKWVAWRGRVYKIDKVGFHHSFWEGSILIHIFSVVSGTLFLKLKLNTQSLKWVLEEVSDEF
ncbi:hypothetical protein ACFL1Q_00085 [Patescibacteria group bacterium]